MHDPRDHRQLVVDELGDRGVAGSIAAAIAGRGGVPAALADPLRDRLSSSISGFDGVAVSELAERTLQVANPAKAAA